MDCDTTLYKYRCFSASSLGMLINKEFYFADPRHLNDPYDCHISILDAIKAAVKHADKVAAKSLKEKIKKLGILSELYETIERDIQYSGVLSFSRIKDHVLMWSHYADEHRGFCLGFRLSKTFTEYNKEHFIIGCCDVHYSPTNPFYEYFIEFANSDELPSYNDFWLALFSLGLVAKSKAWDYEKEVRVLRKEPGATPFSPEELTEVIFGLNMPERHRITIKKLLAGPDWKHVTFREVVRKGLGFELYIEDISSI